MTSVHLNEAQNNPFQPDVQFRGFTVSPLLGLSQGVAIYLDGVRANEPFGDTVNWDLIPMNAIASANVVPGLESAVRIERARRCTVVRDEDRLLASRPHQSRLMGGSFGRQSLEFTSGGARRNLSYFLAANALTEDGWRDHSPTRLGQFFGNVEWRENGSMLGVSVAGGLGRLVGNGPAPVDLLELDRAAVFTHPDRTTTRAAMMSVRGSRTLTRGSIDGVFYVRPAKVSTFNGDDTTYGECEDEDFEELLCHDEGEGDLVSHARRFHDSRGRRPRRSTARTTTRTRERTAGAARCRRRVCRRSGGRENRLIVGATFDRAGSDYEADTEVAQSRRDARHRRAPACSTPRPPSVFDPRRRTRARISRISTASRSRVTLSGSARLTHSRIDAARRAGRRAQR